MAEAVAAVGLTAAIVQFVAFSGKIIKRLDEFASATDNIPATFETSKYNCLFLSTPFNATRGRRRRAPSARQLPLH
jgi:hypothetical protein